MRRRIIAKSSRQAHYLIFINHSYTPFTACIVFKGVKKPQRNRQIREQSSIHLLKQTAKESLRHEVQPYPLVHR